MKKDGSVTASRGRSNLIFLLSTAYCLLSTVFLGCATTSYNGRSGDSTQIPSLEPAALLKFSDIPIPSSLAFVSQDSYVFQGDNFRAGLLKYAGKGTGDQVVVFFKEQMPLYNWHLINIVEYGRRMLSFEKDQETCVITIDDKGNKSDIALSIAPKSQGVSLRKIEKPVK